MKNPVDIFDGFRGQRVLSITKFIVKLLNGMGVQRLQLCCPKRRNNVQVDLLFI